MNIASSQRFTLALDNILLLSESSGIVSPGYASGKCGQAILFCHESMRRNDDELLKHVRQLLDEVWEKVAQQTLSIDLFSGLSGIAWSIDHLCTMLGNETLGISCDFSDELDMLIVHALSSRPNVRSIQHFELVSGLAGIGIAALERTPNKSTAVIYRLVADRLRAISEPVGDLAQITWHTPVRLMSSDRERGLYPNGNYNLGLAHGVPGVIALLGIAAQRQMASPADLDLLVQSVEWLLAQSHLPDALSFSYCVGDNRDARTAWCYGDMGVAIGLTQAALGLNDTRLRSTAVDLAAKSVTRAKGSTGVMDAGLCHGSFGVAHVCSRFYDLTNEERFATARENWLAVSFEQFACTPDEGVFRSFDPINQRWKVDYSLLTGMVGSGLVLSDQARCSRGRWDAPLMCNFQL